MVKNVQKSGCFFAIRPLRCRNGAAVMSQRGCRHVATGRSLQCNKGPVAEPGGPYEAPPRPSPRGGRTDAVHKRLRMNRLRKQWFFRRKTVPILTCARIENLEAWLKNFRKCLRILNLNSEKRGQKVIWDCEVTTSDLHPRMWRTQKSSSFCGRA